MSERESHMKQLSFKAKVIRVSLICIFLLLMPVLVYGQTNASSPPIAQQLVREGTLAVKLQSALSLGTSDDEAVAENSLGDVGVGPRNGWNADYPVTPSVIADLQKTISAAANSGVLSLSKDEALTKFHEVTAELNIPVKPYTGNINGYNYEPSSAQNYSDSGVINDYYYNEGPPAVTYYVPPPDFYPMYTWVPCPFWWSGFWFNGFFVLDDFPVGNRIFISNHQFRDHRFFHSHEGLRVHEGHEFHRSGFVSHGNPRGEMSMSNHSHGMSMPGGGRMIHNGGGRGFTGGGGRK